MSTSPHMRITWLLRILLFFWLLVCFFPWTTHAQDKSAYDEITSKSVPPPSEIPAGKQDQPVLVNVGIETCPPCRVMADSLLELQEYYREDFTTYYYDMHKHVEAGEIYDVRIVPTQIFYDHTGRELYRHQGYLSGMHILEKWQELGYEVEIKVEQLQIRDYFTLEFILSQLSLAIQGAPLTAMLAAFVWGILSIILSPCHIASIPLIIGYINRQKMESTARATLLSLMFALGILVSIFIIGVITALAGRLMGDLGPLPYYLVATVFILFGLNLIGLVPMNWSLVNKLVPQNGNKRGAVILGLIIGVGLGPCTFVFIAPMLGLTLTLSAADQAFGLLLLGIFAVGHCLFLVLAGVSPRFINFFLRWNELAVSSSILRVICGILLIIGGGYLLYYSF